MKFFLFLLLTLVFSTGYAQNKVTVTGIVKNEQNELLAGVTVRIGKSTTMTNFKGEYIIKTRIDSILISYSLIGHVPQTVFIEKSNALILKQDVILKKSIQSLDEVVVSADNSQTGNMQNINLRGAQALPSVSGNFESILKTLPGVSANNELSSQYAVRGGNFDENLVYINDVEIYRPLLVRNGQQEGLSFINPELVQNAAFSAGGFNPQYGDKLSSVLDVQYGRPDSIQTILSAGLIGFSGTVKIPRKTDFLLLGFRNKSNKSILNTQEIRGSYRPDFYDLQIFYQKDVAPRIALSFFGGYNLAKFGLVPTERQTTFGTFDQLLRLNISYEGQEIDRYRSLYGAFIAQYKPSELFQLKWINSVFNNSEEETFDIEGNYIFSEFDSGLSDPELNNIPINRGIGGYVEHARNTLNTQLYSTEIKVALQKKHSYYQWGGRFQHNEISDKLNEFRLIDSAGYTLPANTGSFEFGDVINASNKINPNIVTAYFQNTMNVSQKFTFTGGIRANYHSFTDELLISPRFSLLYKANDNLSLRFSSGIYYQPPFYRELRNYDGSLNQQSRAQRSLHILSGLDYSFKAFKERPMKLSVEAYYKHLSRLIPYKIENLRIRYYADQQAKGYAVGADISLSGEFVKDLTSIFRLSLMKAEEDIKGDFYFKKDEFGSSVRIEPGYLKRPTDQRINFSAFFQDRLLNSPTYKVHLNLLYGSALPIGPPQTARYQDVFNIPAYKRVDIGFSKDVMDSRSKKQPDFLKKTFSSLIFYAEIFNLLNINNTVSYLWIKDVNNYQYAIPNYLTSRQLNFKIVAKIK